MRNKEKARRYNLLYKKMHKVGIRIRDRLYKRLPHVKKKARERQHRYFPQYYEKHRDEILKRAIEWNRLNIENRRTINKRYKEKLKKRLRSSGPKIERLLEEFLCYSKERYHPETVRQYTMSLGRFLSYLERPGARCKEYHEKHYHETKKPVERRDFSWRQDFWKVRLANEIDRELILSYVEYVNHDEINQKGIKLSQSEKEARLYPLKTFLLYCHRKGIIKKDLGKFIYVPPREEKISKRLLTVEEMKCLLEAPSENTSIGVRDRALLELSYSGLRASEILYIKLANIDLNANSIFIFNGKGEKDRVVPMTQEAIYWLRRWLNRRHEFIGNHKDSGFVFITKSKVYPNSSRIDYAYDKVNNLLGVTSPNGATSMTYDKRARMKSATYPSGKTVSYKYYRNGLRKKLTYPDNTYITYTYDTINRSIFPLIHSMLGILNKKLTPT